MTDVNRRDALKAFAVVSAASLVGVTEPQMERALRGLDTISAGADPLQAYTPKFFAAHEWRTLRVLVDYIIPRDARSGSATDARVPEFIDFLMSDRDAGLSSKIAMRGGLAWVEGESRHRFEKRFAEVTDAQRRQILDDIAWPAKARPDMSHGVAFFSRLRDYTASGFFSTAAGWQDVRYIGNVFNPNWDGCPPAALSKLGVTYDVMNTRTSSGQ
jgi:gluconate 2-dehydrogenase gamma chain